MDTQRDDLTASKWLVRALSYRPKEYLGAPLTGEDLCRVQPEPNMHRTTEFVNAMRDEF
jgi:hypothetical protein